MVATTVALPISITETLSLPKLVTTAWFVVGLIATLVGNVPTVMVFLIEIVGKVNDRNRVGVSIHNNSERCILVQLDGKWTAANGEQDRLSEQWGNTREPYETRYCKQLSHTDLRLNLGSIRLD